MGNTYRLNARLIAVISAALLITVGILIATTNNHAHAATKPHAPSTYEGNLRGNGGAPFSFTVNTVGDGSLHVYEVKKNGVACSLYTFPTITDQDGKWKIDGSTRCGVAQTQYKLTGTFSNDARYAEGSLIGSNGLSYNWNAVNH